MNDSNTPKEHQDLAEVLRKRVAGEVRFDDTSNSLYSTDASIYQINPIGIVLPRDADDVVAVVETAGSYGVPVFPRGAGPSLAGQTVGQAIVIDFSKYMRKLLEINTEEGWVKTQPGIIIDELNSKLSGHKVQFAPDPSTSNRANIGGALGNNSCGAHSILWGKTIDHVNELDVVLADASSANLGLQDTNSLKTKTSLEGLEGQIYRGLLTVADVYADDIHNRFPKIQRRVSGYNLDELSDVSLIDTARFVVGSEGTLVAITEAKLRVVQTPKFKGLAILHFNDIIESMEATVEIINLGPAAIELVDQMIVNQARSNLEYGRLMDFVEGDPGALLITEFFGDSENEISAKLDLLQSKMTKKGLGYAVSRITDPKAQANVWSVRKAGLGLMMNVQGEAKPLPFVEDTAVLPERLPEYVRRFDQIVRDHGTTAGYYGHASVGCLHIRPLINLRRDEDVQRMESIAMSISDLVLEFEGAMSGEHGDGLVRSVWNEKMFGTNLYNAFGDVKRAFDPEAIMNPGKIVDSVSMTENLRHRIDYKPPVLKTGFKYQKEGGFINAIEMCNGQGACRKVSSGTMCPSYMVTRDEEHSTRARANALRSVVNGTLPVKSLSSRRIYDVFDLCLGCKGCKAECPSNVDIAKLKYEFLNIYRKSNGLTMRDRLFGNLPLLSKMGSFMAPISNWALGSKEFKDFLESYCGIDHRRSLPKFSSQTFNQWVSSREKSKQSNVNQKDVVLFSDTFTNYNYPELGKDAVKVLEYLGYNVIVPNTACCGRTMMSAGMLDKASHNARNNLEILYPYLERGIKVVGIEPSCILGFRDEYKDLLANDPRANLLSEASMLIEEFVLHAVDEGSRFDLAKRPGRVLFQGHCHQKAMVGTSVAMELLNSIDGCLPEEIDSGCCGMGGSFGYEKEHFDISMQIGEKSLFESIRALDNEVQIVSEGVSCRQQIKDGTDKPSKHLVQLLADMI